MPTKCTAKKRTTISSTDRSEHQSSHDVSAVSHSDDKEFESTEDNSSDDNFQLTQPPTGHSLELVDTASEEEDAKDDVLEEEFMELADRVKASRHRSSPGHTGPDFAELDDGKKCDVGYYPRKKKKVKKSTTNTSDPDNLLPSFLKCVEKVGLPKIKASVLYPSQKLTGKMHLHTLFSLPIKALLRNW